MKFRFLGTGSGNPHPKRKTSSILIEGPYGGLLLDAGEGCSQRLLEPEIWTQEVRSVLITHRHVDHHAGLPMLLSGYKGFGRKTTLEIFAAPPLLKWLQSYCESMKLGQEYQPFDLVWRPLKPGRFAPANGARGEVWQNDHLPESDFGGSYSVTLQLDGRKWLFSADIDTFESIRPHLNNVYGLVIDSHHVKPEESVMSARKLGVREIVLSHVAPKTKVREIDGAIWAKDNMIIDTSR